MREMNLTDVKEEFSVLVQTELQNQERLTGCTQEFDTGGAAFNLPVVGQIDMSQKAASPSGFDAGNIPISDVGQRNIVFSPADYNVKNSLGNAYQTLFNFDIVSIYAKQHAKALARFNDSLKLGAVLLNDGNFTAGNNNLVLEAVGQNTGLNVDKISEAKFKLDANGIDDGMLSLWTNASSMPTLLADERYSNFFYANQKAYTIGGFKYPPVLGVDIRILSEVAADEGKVNNIIPIDAGGKTAAYLVWYDSIGVTYNRRPKSIVVEERWEDRISLLGTGTADSQIIFPKGVVKIELDLT